MKRFQILLLLMMISVCGKAQVKNDLERQHLKGNVKKLTEYDYEVVADKGNVSKGAMKFKAVTDFDAKGNVGGFATYAEDGKLLSRSVYNYNDSGRLVDIQRFRGDGGLNAKTVYQYDAKGYIAEEENYDASGTMFMKGKYKYDFKGNRINFDRFSQHGHLFLRSNYKFDKAGNEIEEREYNSHSTLNYTTKNEYENVDKSGNWTKRTTYKNDEPRSLTEREFEYR